MKILLFGAGGQLGSAYTKYFLAKRVEVARPIVDVRQRAAVEKALREEQPDIVINLAIKADIDWCEANRLTAFEVNTLGADTVGAVCGAAHTYFVQISTGCMQESLSADEAHGEEDPITPLCFYSWTKVWAEELLLHRARREKLEVLILRPRQLLSSELSPRNALTKLLTYSKFIDTPNSCTIVDDLLWVTEELIRRHTTGVYNVANPGILTPYQIAEVLKEIIRPDMQIEKISKEELNRMTKAERIDSVLDCSKLSSLGITLPPAEQRLRDVVEQLKKNLASAEGTALMARIQEQTAKKLSQKISV